jgi:hypothetical protein
MFGEGEDCVLLKASESAPCVTLRAPLRNHMCRTYQFTSLRNYPGGMERQATSKNFFQPPYVMPLSVCVQAASEASSFQGSMANSRLEEITNRILAAYNTQVRVVR